MMTKSFSLVTVLIFAKINLGWSQPGPEQFMSGLRYIEVDSGFSTTFTCFVKSIDTVRYFKQKFDQQNDESVFLNPQQAYISGMYGRGNLLYGIHYLNKTKKDVYVYVYYEGWNTHIQDTYMGREYIDSNVVYLGGNTAAALNRMELAEGTYFVDWSSHQTLPFQRQIVQSVRESNLKVNNWADSVKQTRQHFYLSKTKKGVAEEQLFQETFNYHISFDKTRYLGYYELYRYWTTMHTEKRPYPQDHAVFIITQKAVEAQQVSTKVVSPDELIEYITTGKCVNDDIAKRILSILDQ